MKKLFSLLFFAFILISSSSGQNKEELAENLWHLAYNKYFSGEDINEIDELFKQIELLNPDYPGLYYTWGLLLYNRGNTESSDSLKLRSIEQLKKSIEVSPQHADSYSLLASTLTEYGLKMENDSIFNEGLAAYKKGHTTLTDCGNLCSSWAYSLAMAAYHKKDKAMFDESLGLFREAGVHESENAFLYLMWGQTLTLKAELEGEDKAALYVEAAKTYKKAVLINPELPAVYQAVGMVLLALGTQTNNANYYREALLNFEECLKWDKQSVDAHLGRAYAYFRIGIVEKKLLQYRKQIVDYYMECVQMGSQSAAYNLACYYSLIKEKDEALLWLEKVFSENYSVKIEVDKKKIDEDKDFDYIRKDKRFKKLMTKYLD